METCTRCGFLTMLAPMIIRAFSVVLALLTSSCVSCYYQPLTSNEEPPADLPIGTELSTATELIGMLDQDIDDPHLYYLNITQLPGYSNRFVAKHIPIPSGTTFSVVGFRRPHNLLCYWYAWDVILRSQHPLETSNTEIHIALDRARDASLMKRRAE